MIKVEVIKNFTLERFDELKNIKRKSMNTHGELYVGDTFECDKNMCDYLNGGNDKGKTVIKVIEVIPEKDIIETKFEIRSEEVKELVNEKIKEAEEIELNEFGNPVGTRNIKSKKKKTSKK